MNAVPGVLKTTPRGEVTLKKLAARKFGSAEASGTASQLISRRTPPKLPFAPATVPPPRSALNKSRIAVIEAAFGPAPDLTNWAVVVSEKTKKNRKKDTGSRLNFCNDSSL